jgi:SAM-dependent methyltransferase
MHLKQFVPPAIRPAVRSAYDVVMDQIDLLAGRRDALVPSRRLMCVGGGDFRRVGEAFLRLFRDLGGLKPTDDVLDVGSGIGRMAVPLTRFLHADSQYRGVDVAEAGVEWCQQQITPRFANFRFQRADVFNKLYQPHGRYRAADYRFPFEDNSFDFVLLTSVFTHMLPGEAANYLKQVARVLRPNGRCFATFFLLTPESKAQLAAGRSSQPLIHPADGYVTTDLATPEKAIAFEETAVRSFHRRAGLEIRNPIWYGSWCDRAGCVSYQDIVISTKLTSAAD